MFVFGSMAYNSDVWFTWIADDTLAGEMIAVTLDAVAVSGSVELIKYVNANCLLFLNSHVIV